MKDSTTRSTCFTQHCKFDTREGRDAEGAAVLC